MKKLKLVFQVLIPYVCIMLLMMMSIYYLCIKLRDNYKEKIFTERQASIELATERFQERIKMVENTASLLASNKLVERYAYSTLADSNYSVTLPMELQEELNIYCMNSSLEDIYLYNGKSNKVISSDIVLSNAEYFFQYSYGIEGLTPQEQIDRLRVASAGMAYSPVLSVHTNSSGTLKEDSAMKVIEYRCRVPIEWHGDNVIQMVIVIDAAKLFQDFYTIMEDGDEFYVYDKNNRLMYGSGEKYENFLDSAKESELSLTGCADRQVYGMVEYTTDANWRVKVFIPDKQNDSSMAVPIVWFIVVVPILASIILSFWFTFKNYVEIADVLSMFQDHRGAFSNTEDGNEKLYGYEKIKKNALEIITENQRYHESIVDLKLKQKYLLMDKLICNAYESREEIVNVLEKNDFDKWDSKVIVLCIWYEGSDYRKMVNENQSIKELVGEVLLQSVEREVEFFEKTARESVCILFVKEMDNINNEIQEIISKLNVAVFYPFNIKVKIGVGNIVDSVYETAISYEQAKKVVSYKSDIGKNVYFYSELIERKDSYYYPDACNDKISSYIILGKAENAKELVRQLYEENFEKSEISLSDKVIGMLKGRLEECILGLAEKYEVAQEQVLTRMHQMQNIEKYFELLYEVIDLLVTEIASKKNEEQNQLVNSIIEYIGIHYSENSLGLKQIAHEFGFQENYMSKLFKSSYGENVSVMIEKTRIEKACDLLKDTDMIISEISVNVGYNSDISFRRAFKKVMGITPGEYREL